MKRYAVVRNNQIMSVILWDGVSEYSVEPGATLMLESDALAQSIPWYVPPDPTVKAQAAIATNRANVTQDQTIASQADVISNGTGTMTLAQLTTTVRQLAQGLAALARNDATSNKQRTALIQQVLALYDDTST